MSSSGPRKAVIPDLTPVQREALRRGCQPLHVATELLLPPAYRHDSRPPAQAKQPQHQRSHSCPFPSGVPIEPRPAPPRDQTEAQPQNQGNNSPNHTTTTASTDWPTFFPAAKRHIIQAPAARHVGLSPSLLNLPKPRCPICREQLSLAGFEANPNLEPARLLGSGHIVGKDCLADYINQVAHEDGNFVECPVCRFSFLDPKGCARHRLVAHQNLSPALPPANPVPYPGPISEFRQKEAALPIEEFFPLNKNFFASLAVLSRE